MASSSSEQSQMRFLAIVLPVLTFCAHGLLAMSFALPGSDLDSAYFPITYNLLACGASILGLVGALRASPSLVSAYTLLHTMTLSFLTIAIVNLVLPWDFRTLNPVTPSYTVDVLAICRDIDAGFGWDTEWLEQCTRGLSTVKFWCAGFSMVLIFVQWWALMSVRTWGQEQRARSQSTRGDVEKAGLGADEKTTTYDQKSGL
ncbi:hypothetical protein COCC4DRAFT_169700 [Bipolaris maydis ATCC 48331]|uniref:Uncharacterized protein n=2 Tax=Cochliobolus heterostrophus TaxID=5016 RepID=M2UZA8_COCH5|nr:uncharacterized protein COCC4DRAFT_169700 [Bipolaris maydis ATCC 48331]EMD93067.1 hypothetical protein COCHEDRAFT_1193396 [Bipolaris maydis C5]KAJ5025882.1 hypothetical protein J3E73DRAFT_423743 [Bipolaris maydis]ENI04544.1 hypothetical protein COCC4DRAFT_169700 [Bipolaris maydis ATCC 48331]KAJ5056414.1 hypothetical protein J3E74DRAFT_278866 [Bipolaris maydis]KAJ6196009.1 hypothetical protein J3E72DRAFT_220679 [Bipolaris maydis]